MNRKLMVVMIIGVMALLSTIQPQTTAAQSDPTSQIVAEVNALRASLGLFAYTVNAALTAAAQGHAEWMAANHNWSHQGAGGSIPQDRATAAGYRGWVRENVASGTPSYSPSLVVYHWGQSPGHRPTMVSTDYVHIGVGYARSSQDYDVYVLMAGYTSGSAPAQPAVDPAAAPLVIQPVQVSGPREDGSIAHVVQPGETAWDIAAAYGVEVAELLALNGLSNDPLLHPGDEVMVQAAGGAPITAAAAEGLTHTVGNGETAWTIAAHYGISLDDLLAANGLGPEPLLHPGDRLTIPGVESDTPEPAASEPTAVLPTMTAVSQAATEPPSPPPPTPTATNTPVPATEPPPTPSPPPPMPTLASESAPSSPGGSAAIGAVVIAVGAILFLGMAAIELYERFGRRRR